MALVKTDDVVLPSRGFNGLSLLRQLGLMVGLAASVAIGFAIVQWSQDPGYRMLYSNLSEQDSADIANSLQSAAIPYKVDTNTGALLVAGKSLHEARLKLASQGLPRGGGVGFEMLDKDQGFGVSQFMEGARYQRALEGELARTIGSLNRVRGARVHLAIPKQTAFARARKKPKASITVDLFAGRTLDEGQITAISHMVAASITGLEVSDVTVIDQKGRLLTSSDSSSDMRVSSTQFNHRKRLEEYYIKRIEGILSPIVGEAGVRAQVSADIDFTVTEQTQESFNPDLPAIRSEQTFEERRTTGSQTLSGVPGSLSNQPPENAAALTGGESAPVSSTIRATRNYELDRTISHIRSGGGDIKRLSIAVVLDDKESVDENGEAIRVPLTDDEIIRITTLVKEAVGFNGQRGDSVNVINSRFKLPEEVEPLPEPAFMDNPGLWDTGKQVLAGAVIFFLLFGVLRPVLRELAAKGEVMPAQVMIQGQGATSGMQNDQLTLSAGGGAPKPDYENNLNTARSIATQDPKRVAQVVNNWVATDGG
ncbi:MAG: flagellar M-ring protein FliF [Gammaproteobacteria bacterium]|nr:flagellar M-ring protein FliF [Gammaproteobacteria bacterium]